MVQSDVATGGPNRAFSKLRSLIEPWYFLSLMPMADWLGLKITPSQLKLWERERAEGKWYFIFKRGLSIGLYCAVLALLEYWFSTPVDRRSIHNLLIQGLVGIVFFLIGGLVWGMYAWHMIEKRFFGQRQSLIAEEESK